MSGEGDEDIKWVRMDSQGRITIPSKIRKEQNLHQNDIFLMKVENNGGGFKIILKKIEIPKEVD